MSVSCRFSAHAVFAWISFGVAEDGVPGIMLRLESPEGPPCIDPTKPCLGRMPETKHKGVRQSANQIN